MSYFILLILTVSTDFAWRVDISSLHLAEQIHCKRFGASIETQNFLLWIHERSWSLTKRLAFFCVQCQILALCPFVFIVLSINCNVCNGCQTWWPDPKSLRDYFCWKKVFFLCINCQHSTFSIARKGSIQCYSIWLFREC